MRSLPNGMTDFGSLDPLFLDRVLAGDASAAERAAVLDWAAQDPQNAQLLAALQRRVESADDMPLAKTDASWQALHARLRGTDAQRFGSSAGALGLHRAPRPNRWSATAVGVAAALLLAVGGTLTWRITRTTMHEARAPLGRSESITLTDGSKVVLAPGSRLVWNSHFGDAARDVLLEGEAYFDVVHDTTRPFRVRARDGVAEDVGTRFVVRAWRELPSMEVAVEEGAVALTDSIVGQGPAVVTLQAGDLGRLAADGAVDVQRDADALLAWTRGELVFDNVPLTEALPSISRWYDADVRSDTSLGARRLSARFTKQPLADVLDALSLALDARVVRDGRTVTLVARTSR